MAVFNVYIDVLLSMRYEVRAATPDEAETLVEGMALRGVKGTVIEREVMSGAAERVADHEELEEEVNEQDEEDEEDE